MSGLDGLQLDADGYLDMDQFPDDGTDLAGAELDSLREALHSDPVEEPTPDQWDAMFDDVVADGDTGPFALDDVEGLTADDDATPEADDLPDTDDLADDADVSADDVIDDLDGDGDAGLDGFDAADDLDLDVTADDGGLDLGPDLDVDDAFSPEALDDGPADIANNDFEDLL